MLIYDYLRGNSNNTWHFRGEGSKNVTRQFLLVISVVKVDKKCQMGEEGGGGSKKCKKVSRIISMAPNLTHTKSSVVKNSSF